MHCNGVLDFDAHWFIHWDSDAPERLRGLLKERLFLTGVSVLSQRLGVVAHKSCQSGDSRSLGLELITATTAAALPQRSAPGAGTWKICEYCPDPNWKSPCGIRLPN
jgi:hypothetical protein